MEIINVVDNNCPFCPKQCKTAAGLDKHLQAHVRNGELVAPKKG